MNAVTMDDVIAGTLVFTGERSQAGYRLNRMAMSLTDPTNREAFVADENGYMRNQGLTDAEIAMVRERNWKAMIEAGGSIYLIIKIAGAVGVPLYAVGAHTAGMTYEQFMAQRQGR
jgi:protocatechuate 4,5-dioxygenase, alpha chain